ncbi:MAG: hypothetical protein IKH00_04610 [Bacteroidales bacterium]|nr:hypothetical protein [Bacteroidales bacterium]
MTRRQEIDEQIKGFRQQIETALKGIDDLEGELKRTPSVLLDTDFEVERRERTERLNGWLREQGLLPKE